MSALTLQIVPEGTQFEGQIISQKEFDIEDTPLSSDQEQQIIDWAESDPAYRTWAEKELIKLLAYYEHELKHWVGILLYGHPIP